MTLPSGSGTVSKFSQFRHSDWMPALAGMTVVVETTVIRAQAGIWRLDVF